MSSSEIQPQVIDSNDNSISNGFDIKGLLNVNDNGGM